MRGAVVWTLLSLMAVCVCAQQPVSGTLEGIIRDGQGKAIVGVAVTLNRKQTTASVPETRTATGTETMNETGAETLTGASGSYRFTGLAAGQYTMIARHNGYQAASQTDVLLNSSPDPVIVDLVLPAENRPASNQSAFQWNSPSSNAMSPNTSLPSTSSPSTSLLAAPPQFQAARIHGLIDPGGYSVSANADAASGVLKGIADVKRSGRSFRSGAANDWPCTLEPVLQNTLQTHPDDALSNRKLGEFYIAHEQPEKAEPLLQRALQINSNDLDAQKAMGIAQLESGQFDAARKVFASIVDNPDEAKERKDSWAEIHQLLARAEEGLGMFKEAAEEYRVANAIKVSEEGLFGQAYEVILSGDPAAALNVFREGEIKYPKSIQIELGTGTAQFLEGHTTEGLQTFLKASEIDPEDSRPYAFIAAASGSAKSDGDKVLAALKRFLDHHPESASANYLYAMVLSRRSKENVESTQPSNNQIASLLQRAIQLDPGLARAHLQLAEIYEQRGEYAKAIPEFQATVNLSPDLSEAHYRLAMALKHAGRTEEFTRELTIFQQQKTSRSAPSDFGGVDLAEFISVMDAPASHGEAPCATQAR